MTPEQAKKHHVFCISKYELSKNSYLNWICCCELIKEYEGFMIGIQEKKSTMRCLTCGDLASKCDLDSDLMRSQLSLAQ